MEKKENYRAFQKKLDKINAFEQNAKLSAKLDENMQLMDALFKDVDVLVKREFKNQFCKELNFCLYFSDGVSNTTIINDFIIGPILSAKGLSDKECLLNEIKLLFLPVNDVKDSQDIQQIVSSVTYGDTVLFIDGCENALIINSKAFTLRGISEPEQEKVLLGPREGFNEGIMTNLSLIRRRLRTNHLKMTFQTIGKESATTVCLCYIDTIVNPAILAEIKRRLENIEIDAVLDSNYLAELISETSLLQLTLCGYTERPDVVAGRLLEGRVAIFVDGSPIVLTAPYLFIENLQSNEDYYTNPVYASFARILRVIAFVLSITIPAAYISIVAYHQEILSTALLISIAMEQIKVPLPAAVEAFVMLICYDTLREAGVRMPSQVGQALSIVGALVIGQAAVSAGLVASPMIIIVALTGITTMVTPKLTPTMLICRYGFLLLSSFFGLFGTLISLAVFLTHLLNAKTFGVPYLLMPNRLSTQVITDSFVRLPRSSMLNRYLPLSFNHRRAQSKER